MASRNAKKTNYDSDSSSECIPDDDGKNEQPAAAAAAASETAVDEDCPWRSAVDPNSGKTYYYHTVTRETQWRKPIEMASREEREAVAAKEKRQKEFFAAMESNILNSISQGFKAPEKKNKLDLEFESKAISDDPLAPKTATSAAKSSRKLSIGDSSHGGRSNSMRRGLGGASNHSSRSPARSRPDLIRTISSMDSSVLRELIKRVPSSRQVRGVPAPRQLSNHSLGSRQQSRPGRLGSRKGSSRGVNQKGPLLNAAKAREMEEADDDELPPLTVLTTPDLRQRESLANDPRDNLVRENSLALEQVCGGLQRENSLALGSLFAGGSGSGSGGSLEYGNPNKFSFSNSEIHFDPDASSSSQHSLGGGSRLNAESFSSFNSSGNLMGDTSHHHSVSSNLMTVEEGNDDDSVGYSKLKVDTANEIVLECEQEDDESPDNASFNLGDDSAHFGHEGTTENFLAGLPDDSSIKDEEMVGYGNDAKPFSDAGFTSFFDESMANFGLSEKETKALQKLAAITEQMTLVLETDESDEDDEDGSESEEDSDESLCRGMHEIVLPGREIEYHLDLESSERGDDSTSSAENEGNRSPSFQTPRTSSTNTTTRTTSTAASSASPVHRPPPRRMLGPKTHGVYSKKLESTEALPADSDSNPASKSGYEISLPALGLGLPAATLTTDNARSHISESMPKGRRQSDNLSPTREMNVRQNSGMKMSDHSSSSIHSTKSTNSIAMANAARRLSMFRLKNNNYSSRLRHVGKDDSPSATKDSGAKSNLGESPAGAERDMSSRPELVRRNTCGTLYVGTTMSDPDKDATIKVRRYSIIGQTN